MVMDCFQEQSNDFQVMPWPPNSSEIKPIEHFCSNLLNQSRDAMLPSQCAGITLPVGECLV